MKRNRVEEPRLPAFDYYLDESDPDVVLAAPHDDVFVAAFSAAGATREGITQAAKEDYWALVREHARSGG